MPSWERGFNVFLCHLLMISIQNRISFTLAKELSVLFNLAERFHAFVESICTKVNTTDQARVLLHLPDSTFSDNHYATHASMSNIRKILRQTR